MNPLDHCAGTDGQILKRTRLFILPRPPAPDQLRISPARPINRAMSQYGWSRSAPVFAPSKHPSHPIHHKRQAGKVHFHFLIRAGIRAFAPIRGAILRAGITCPAPFGAFPIRLLLARDNFKFRLSANSRLGQSICLSRSANHPAIDIPVNPD